MLSSVAHESFTLPTQTPSTATPKSSFNYCENAEPMEIEFIW